MYGKGRIYKNSCINPVYSYCYAEENDIRKSNILTLVALNPIFSFLYRCKTHDFGFIKHIAKT
jgi:hypothetical protein